MADLIYDAGEEFSHNPQGEEVTLESEQSQAQSKAGEKVQSGGEAKQIGKDEVDIEKPCEYDANTVPSESASP
jgi:hypothetical protein